MIAVAPKPLERMREEELRELVDKHIKINRSEVRLAREYDPTLEDDDIRQEVALALIEAQREARLKRSRPGRSRKPARGVSPLSFLQELEEAVGKARTLHVKKRLFQLVRSGAKTVRRRVTLANGETLELDDIEYHRKRNSDPALRKAETTSFRIETHLDDLVPEDFRGTPDERIQAVEEALPVYGLDAETLLVMREEVSGSAS